MTDTELENEVRSTGDRGMRTALLVDDEEMNLAGLALFFEQRGFQVRACQTAAAALQAVRTGLRPDLIVTDYRMPDMNGLALVEELRRALPEAKTIMITAAGDVDSYIRSMSLGVFEYIHKPFNERELDRIVTAAIGDAGAPQS